MSSGLVVHIVSGEDKHTEVLTHDRIRIGSGEDCDVHLRASDLPLDAGQTSTVLELARTNGHYCIAAFDRGMDITHNGRPLELNRKIRDGDEVRVNSTNLGLTFFPFRAMPALVPGSRRERQVAPFIEQAAMEAAATPRRDDAKVFLREFTRELVREINLSTKLISLVIVLALVIGVLYIGTSLVRELREGRRLIDAQRAQIAQMKTQSEEANEQLSNQLSDLGRSNKEIRDSLSLAVKLRSDFGRGVCLISGSFIFVEQGTGRPLRYPEAQTREDGEALQNGAEALQLTPEGKGSIAEFEFVGTGFYVGGGLVLTNRHVAQPWIADERAQSLNSTVTGKPRLRRLNAYFPDRTQPIGLKFQSASPRDDLAVCSLDVKDTPPEIPVLPLEKEQDAAAAAVGTAVVMMGYPSGPDRLLALLDEAEARGIQARYGSSLESLLGFLSDTRHIQPLTTQGHITDLDPRRIVYDARTSEGGSGAPLFGPSGKVIGVNFAVFTENTASNFAVPVRFAIPLLQRANWQAPEAPSGEQSENTNQTQTNSRTVAAAPNTPR
jgi:S1-C subfamily serine protease